MSAHYDYLEQGFGGIHRMNGVILNISYDGSLSGYSKLNWIQNKWTTNSPNTNDLNGVRQLDGEAIPFYFSFDRIQIEKRLSGTSRWERQFQDQPGRSASFSNYSFEAEVSLVGYRNGSFQNILTIRWGYFVPAPNVIVPYWYQTNPSQDQLNSIKNAK